MRILLVDDHAMFSAGLRSLLQTQFPEAVVSSATSGAAALEHLDEASPDLVLMDLHLPDRSGIDVSQDILARRPHTKIMILSGELDLSFVDPALQAGISAYLLKTDAAEELGQAIRAVLAGRLYLCPEANAYVLQGYRRKLGQPEETGKQELSGREREVLRRIAEGVRTKDIARELNLSAKTVETYRQRLMRKLAFTSTAALTRYAVREGIVPP